jgi:polygalacturonase
VINAVDVQLTVNQVLGILACTTGDVNHDGACNIVDVQWVISAALGGTCRPSAPSPTTFNVKNYGAQGDGATNDTAAVQAATNAAHAAGSGTVYFPSSSGCYMVTSLTFYSGLSYTGENQSVCLHSISDNAAIIATPSGSAFSDASISYLTFAGSGAVTGGYDCLELRGPTNVIIDHVTTTGCAEDGFYITGYGTNFATAGDGLLVTNSMATNSGRNGMSIIAGKNITVRDSVFQYSNRGAPFDGVDIEPNRADQVVENITFENCSFLNNGNSGSSASGHMGFNVWEAFASLPNLNLRLINNTYSGNLRDGLYAAASGYTLSGIYVIGGTMSNNQALNGYRGGVDIWNTSNVVVSNLTVTSPSQAVFLYGVNSAQIANSSLSGMSVDLNTNTSTNVQVYPSTMLVHGTHAGLYTTLSGTAPVITTTSLPFGTTGAAYAELLTATGDPTITWTTLTATGNSMPSGVVLSPGGVLSGVPAASGSYTFTIQASNGITFDEKTYTLTVN